MPHIGELQQYQSSGDWTPVFKENNGGPAIVFTITEARFIRTGKLVVASFFVVRNDASALAAAITWSLPFPSDGTSGLIPCGEFWAIGKALGPVLMDNFANNIANGLVSASGGTNTYLRYSDLANGESLGVTMTYQAI